MAFDLLTYKPDQGRPTRNSTFLALGALSWYGASTFHYFLTWDWARKSLGFTIPVVNIDVTTGFLLATVLFFALLAAVRFGINHPKAAELLIDTEAELKRVTWPSWPETLNGSLVVIITVVALLVILAGADFVLSNFFERWIF
jgi:preprotein translocase SecE subunit